MWVVFFAPFLGYVCNTADQSSNSSQMKDLLFFFGRTSSLSHVCQLIVSWISVYTWNKHGLILDPRKRRTAVIHLNTPLFSRSQPKMKLGKDESNSGWLRYAMYEFILGHFFAFCFTVFTVCHTYTHKRRISRAIVAHLPYLNLYGTANIKISHCKMYLWTTNSAYGLETLTAYKQNDCTICFQLMCAMCKLEMESVITPAPTLMLHVGKHA